MEDRDDIVFEPPEIGCVLHLGGRPFDGPIIQDNSPYGNNGTITGSVWVRLPSGLWVNGFDNTDDYISIPHASNLNITGDLTILVWLYRASRDTYDTVLLKGSEATSPYQIIFVSYGDMGNHEAFFYSHEKADLSGIQQVLSTNDTFVMQQWHFLAITRQVPGNIIIYRNCVPDIAPVVTDGTPLSNAVDSVDWGKRAAFWFHGYMWGQRMFPRALSATEIANIYNQERQFFY